MSHDLLYITVTIEDTRGLKQFFCSICCSKKYLNLNIITKNNDISSQLFTNVNNKSVNANNGKNIHFNG